MGGVCLVLLGVVGSSAARGEPPPPEALPHDTTGPDPGYAKELQAFCDIEGISGANRVKDPKRRAELINNYLLSEPMSPRFHRFFYDRLGTADDAQKATLLREEMKANGIEHCTFPTTRRRWPASTARGSYFRCAGTNSSITALRISLGGSSP
jgi:hypothetical protein